MGMDQTISFILSLKDLQKSIAIKCKSVKQMDWTQILNPINIQIIQICATKSWVLD